MKDVLGNSLICGDKVLLLSNSFYEGTSNVRNLWSETYGIVVGENQIFIKRIKNHECVGYKIVNSDEVILVSQCDKKSESIFNDLQHEYLSQIQSQISKDVYLKPGTVFRDSTGYLYVYLGLLDISTYCYYEYNNQFMKRECLKGRICIDFKKLINLNGKTIKNKELYNYTYDVDKYYSNMFSNNNSKGLIEKLLFNMDTFKMCVDSIIGELHLENIYVNKSYYFGKYNKQLRLEVLERI